ncbi:MAG TPA: hypothetical protein VK988_02425 [Acidimicrobiales bacterium]|nr:hypothetical protein [Acidimicrobiales bacterium]
MPRLLVGTQWYEAIASRSWIERDFERVLIDRAEQLFPSWRCAEFRETIEGEDGVRKQPDLALVDRHCRHWWVVEVELAHHDLHNHVIPQVDAFRTGRYGERHAVALARALPELGLERLRLMMLGVPPEVLVLVDSPNTAWSKPLREHGVLLGVVEPFRDENNQLILRLNGHQPDLPGEIISRCSRRPDLRRLWKVHSPATLIEGDQTPVVIEYQGVQSEWSIVRLSNAIFMQPVRGDVLVDLTVVELLRQEDGTLSFEPVQPQPRRRRS